MVDTTARTSIVSGLIRLALITFLSSPALADDAWVQLRDPAGVFTVSFPASPTVISDSTVANNGATIPITEYMLDHGEMALIVMVGDFTNQTVDPEAALNGAVNGVQSEGRTLQSDTTDPLDGQLGRSVVFIDSAGKRYTDRIFFIEGYMYQAITALPGNPTDEQSNIVARFNQSFHFQ